MTRRFFIASCAAAAAGLLVAACAPKIVKETVIVEKEVEKVVKEVVLETVIVEGTPQVVEKEVTRVVEKEVAPKEQVVIRFITNHGEADMPLFKKVIANFEEAYPNMKIDHLDIAGGGDFYTTINTQGAAGDLPDIWYTRTFDVPVYASKKWTISLQPYIDADPDKVRVEDFWPGEVAQMQWEGELYALPYDFSNIGIYYNMDMFDEAGVAYPPANWQWADLVGLALNFVEKEEDQFTKWGLSLYPWDWVFMGLLFGWGGQVWTDDFRTCIIDSPESYECLKFFEAARKQGVYPEAGAAPEGVNPFAAGLVPMSFEGSWATVWMRDSIGDKFVMECTSMPLSPTGVSCLNGAGGAWGIASTSKIPDQTWEFNKFLASTESNIILISEPLRSIPARKSAVPAWKEKAAEGGLPPKNVQVFAEQNKITHAAPYPPYWRDYGTAWGNMIVPLINGQLDEDVGTVLAAFQQEVNRIIDMHYQL